MTRSQSEFAFGLATGDRNTSTPNALIESSRRLAKIRSQIVDQVAMPSSIPHDFPQLLQSPVGVRIRSNVDMSQASRAVLDHHEHVQHPERRSDGNEKVTSNDGRGVVTQKCRPALIATRTPR